MGYYVIPVKTASGEINIDGNDWEKVAQDAWKLILSELPAGASTVQVGELILDEMKLQLKRMSISTL